MTVRTAALAPCGIRHVPLDGPGEALAAAPGERGLYVVFWRGGRPAGARVLAAEELPVPAAAARVMAADAAAEFLLRETAAPAAAPPLLRETAGPAATPLLRAVAAPAQTPVREAAERAGGSVVREAAAGAPLPAVSVVVCTRDRPEDLRRCLASLAACDPAPAEVLVVDNAPRAGTAEAVVRSFPGMRCLHEPAPGLSHARNTGVRAATGEVVAFTDDDVVVRPDWIARLAAPFAESGVACVTGLVVPADLGGEAACLFEFEVGAFGHGFAPRRYDAGFLRERWWRSPEVWRIGAGANMAVRRAAFGEVGLFDPRLGAGASGCSEDSEFWFRLLRGGMVCRYEPGSVVFHHHRPDRAGLARQLRAYVRGHTVALLVQFAQDRRACHLVRAFLVMPLWYGFSLVQALRSGDPDRVALIGPQLRGWAEGPLSAPHWLRRPGPPRLLPATPQEGGRL